MNISTEPTEELKSSLNNSLSSPQSLSPATKRSPSSFAFSLPQLKQRRLDCPSILVLHPSQSHVALALQSPVSATSTISGPTTTSPRTSISQPNPKFASSGSTCSGLSQLYPAKKSTLSPVNQHSHFQQKNNPASLKKSSFELRSKPTVAQSDFAASSNGLLSPERTHFDRESSASSTSSANQKREAPVPPPKSPPASPKRIFLNLPQFKPGPLSNPELTSLSSYQREDHNLDFDSTFVEALNITLQSRGITVMNFNSDVMDSSIGSGRKDSIATSGAKAITIGGANPSNRNRRESLANTGSFMGGISWTGGMSLGSFVRDEMALHGTSPFGVHASPAAHSSSYLPKLEANFMKDFQCCGRTLADLHDLLQHYEEAHTNNASPNTRPAAAFSQFARIGVNNAGPGQRTPSQLNSMQSQFGGPAQLAQQGRQLSGMSGLNMMGHVNLHPTSNLQSMALSEDLGDIDDMDMDDTVGHMEMDDPQQQHQQQQQRVIQQTRQMFGQGTDRPQIQINASGITQGLRTSQPTTPAVQSFGLQHNPTVSSVNTPTLSTQPGGGMFPRRASGQPFIQSATGHEDITMMDQDFSGMNQNMAGAGGMDLSNISMAEDTNCIPNPGKNLNSGGLLAHQKILLAQLAMEQPDFQSKAPYLQRLGLLPEENKPFKCPVIGCEKTYKNQNGLKYHKMHGHQSQVLHENEDGTFSIVDPETSVPYPGTQGMEKEKPYHCNVCMKRYKNLNGLKYHRNHSPYCNPDLTQAELLAMTGINLNNLAPQPIPEIPQQSQQHQKQQLQLSNLQLMQK